ncbi:MAG: tetratricopeptide repeat protein [Hyphomicrobium sp.]
MTAQIAMASLAASLMMLAMVLGIVRLAYGQSPARTRVVVSKWLRMPGRRAGFLIAAVTSLSGLAYSRIDDALLPSAASQPQATAWALPGIANAQCRAENPSAEGCDPAINDLQKYADGVEAKQSVDAAFGSQDASANLPDVGTMIARLVKRLEDEPGDKNGWRTLGWSYENTGQFGDAVKAYETALALDPQNTELAAAVSSAKSKTEGKQAAGPSTTPGASTSPDNAKQDAATPAVEAASGPGDQQAMIRSMVERLAARLETAPKDAEGWLRLMRSRTVLGEKDLAQEALRKALAAFASDKAERDRLAEAAKEFGLSAQ